MPVTRKRWGLVLFAGSLVCAAACWGFVRAFAPAAYPRLYSLYLPVTGALLAFVTFLVGHFSYPRTHSLKVYLSSFLVGLAGLACFGLQNLAAPQPEAAGGWFVRLLYCFVFVNGLIVPLVPSSIKYRVSQQLTLTVVILEAVLLALLRWVPAGRDLGMLLAPGPGFDYLPWAGAAWAAAVTVLTVRLVSAEFHLGGLLSGTSVVYAAGLLLPLLDGHVREHQTITFALACLYHGAGVLVHAFIRMEHRAAIDPLLHVYNRQFCTQILSEHSSINTAPPFTLAMVDIDHFKKVNDTYGHQAGDHVLYVVAQTLSREVAPNGVVCRYGGEEIAVFFPQRTLAEVKGIMEAARIAMEKTRIQAGRRQISVTISCGIAQRVDPAQPLTDLVAAADKALYRAKEGGRNQVRAATPASLEKKGERTTRSTTAIRPAEARRTTRIPKR